MGSNPIGFIKIYIVFAIEVIENKYNKFKFKINLQKKLGLLLL